MTVQPSPSSMTIPQSRRHESALAALRVPLIAPIALLAFLSAFLVTTDPDYWWHERTGRFILETGTLPRADIFSYTVAGQPWITHEWLSEVLYAAVANSWGYLGNAILFGLVGALTAWLVFATGHARGVGSSGAAFLALWSFVIAFPVTNWRPQLFTTLLLALYALLLTRAAQGQTRYLWALPPLMIVWVNLHGGYVIGLVLLGLAVIGGAWSQLQGQAAPPLRPLLVTTALTAAATLVSPLGLEGLRYPLIYAGSNNFAMRYIADFQSPNFHETMFFPFALSILLTIALGFTRPSFVPTDLLWTLAFTFLALQSVRHIQLYAVIVLPLLGARLAAGAGSSWLAKILANDRLRFASGLLLWLLPALAGVALFSAVTAGSGAQVGAAPSAIGYPRGGADYLLANRSQGNLFNEFQWGGYLLYRLYPQQRVFIDGRADVYGNTFVTRYLQITRLQTDWQSAFAEDRIDLALVGKGSALALALQKDPAWQELYTGDVERLFARR